MPKRAPIELKLYLVLICTICNHIIATDKFYLQFWVFVLRPRGEGSTSEWRFKSMKMADFRYCPSPPWKKIADFH